MMRARASSVPELAAQIAEKLSNISASAVPELDQGDGTLYKVIRVDHYGEHLVESLEQMPARGATLKIVLANA